VFGTRLSSDWDAKGFPIRTAKALRGIARPSEQHNQAA